MNKNSLIYLAGGLWVAIGVFLVYRSSLLYHLAVKEQHATDSAIWISVLAGLAIGAVKGKFVLSKTACKNKSRIENIPPPLKIYHLFAKPFYGLIPAMIILGMALRHWNMYLGGYIVVAAIYLGIGAALFVSGLAYWRDKPKPV